MVEDINLEEEGIGLREAVFLEEVGTVLMEEDTDLEVVMIPKVVDITLMVDNYFLKEGHIQELHKLVVVDQLDQFKDMD